MKLTSRTSTWRKDMADYCWENSVREKMTSLTHKLSLHSDERKFCENILTDCQSDTQAMKGKFLSDGWLRGAADNGITNGEGSPRCCNAPVRGSQGVADTVPSGAERRVCSNRVGWESSHHDVTSGEFIKTEEGALCSIQALPSFRPCDVTTIQEEHNYALNWECATSHSVYVAVRQTKCKREVTGVVSHLEGVEAVFLVAGKQEARWADSRLQEEPGPPPSPPPDRPARRRTFRRRRATGASPRAPPRGFTFVDIGRLLYPDSTPQPVPKEEAHDPDAVTPQITEKLTLVPIQLQAPKKRAPVPETLPNPTTRLPLRRTSRAPKKHKCCGQHTLAPKKRFQCLVCGASFTSSLELYSHSLGGHVEHLGAAQCSFCLASFHGRPKVFRRHVTLHYEITR